MRSQPHSLKIAGGGEPRERRRKTNGEGSIRVDSYEEVKGISAPSKERGKSISTFLWERRRKRE